MTNTKDFSLRCDVKTEACRERSRRGSRSHTSDLFQQQFRDLDGVERGAFEQLIAADEQINAVGLVDFLGDPA